MKPWDCTTCCSCSERLRKSFSVTTWLMNTCCGRCCCCSAPCWGCALTFSKVTSFPPNFEKEWTHQPLSCPGGNGLQPAQVRNWMGITGTPSQAPERHSSPQLSSFSVLTSPLGWNGLVLSQNSSVNVTQNPRNKLHLLRRKRRQAFGSTWGASSGAALCCAEQSAEEFVMEEGAVLCQKDQDSQKTMKAILKKSMS